MSRHVRPKHGWLIGVTSVLLTVALVSIVPGIGHGEGRPRPVRVMTRNIYLGADLTPLANATNVDDLAMAGSHVWDQVLATSFPARAAALAREIRDADPKLIGLQEVALWRTGVPDGPPLFNGTAASEIVFDFLQTLLDELEGLGMPYDVVAVQDEIDVEFFTASGFDARVTLRDVILARAGLPADELSIVNVESHNFSTHLSLPLLNGSVSIAIVRGWISVDATVNRRAFRLVSTHLEAFSNCIRTLQIFELLAGPLAMSTPTVLIGDLNSAPNDPVFTEPNCPVPGSYNPYALLVANGFVDTWEQANPTAPGFTCCNAADLLNPLPSHTERIDHVLARPGVNVYSARVVGTDPDGRTDDSLWPSDHAGVIAVLAP